MKKLMKLSATLLFAFCLSACEKPDPAADFKKLVEFGEKQQQSQAAFQSELRQKLATQDPQQIEAALTEFNQKVMQIAKELDAVEVKSEEIKAFKAKMKQGLTLSNELLSDGIQLMKSPTEELQKTLQEKTQNALALGKELQQLQTELQKKYTETK